MKTMRFLFYFSLTGAFVACQPQTAKQSTSQSFVIGEKEYSLDEIENIVSFYEESQNLNDIDSAYFDTTIPINAGGRIDKMVALERMKYFREFARGKKQPHGFSYGLETIDSLRKDIQRINDSALANGEPLFYTGIRIYVSRHKTKGEWNTILVGVREDGRDLFTGNKDWNLTNEPVYNSSLPCPSACP